MAKRPAQTPENSGAPSKRRVIDLDDLFEPVIFSIRNGEAWGEKKEGEGEGRDRTI
jgi:hypothetical protein